MQTVLSIGIQHAVKNNLHLMNSVGSILLPNLPLLNKPYILLIIQLISGRRKPAFSLPDRQIDCPALADRSQDVTIIAGVHRLQVSVHLVDQLSASPDIHHR